MFNSVSKYVLTLGMGIMQNATGELSELMNTAVESYTNPNHIPKRNLNPNPILHKYSAIYLLHSTFYHSPLSLNRKSSSSVTP